MAMNQPIPPEQQPEVVAEQTTVEPVANDTAVVQDTAVVEEVPQDQAAQEAQVIDTVAQGLEEEEISAMDIMTAVLSESLGLSRNGAENLVNLLLTDIAEDMSEATDVVEEQSPM